MSISVARETPGLSNVGVAIVGAMSKWERKPADFYPTPADVTYSLIPHIEAILPIGSRVWEPACGDGAMAKPLIECGYEVDSSDLREDSGYGEQGVNFLHSDRGDEAYDAIITNPPFNVAEDFIQHSLKQAPVVAMLLKSQYWHAARRRKLFELYPPLKVLPLTWRPSFLEKERGKSPLMDVQWTIWKRGHSGPTSYYPIARVTQSPIEQNFDAMFG